MVLRKQRKSLHNLFYFAINFIKLEKFIIGKQHKTLVSWLVYLFVKSQFE